MTFENSEEKLHFNNFCGGIGLQPLLGKILKTLLIIEIFNGKIMQMIGFSTGSP